MFSTKHDNSNTSQAFNSVLLPTVIALILITMLSACQLTPKAEPKVAKNTHKTLHYSHYYLWLKTLSPQELVAEIDSRKKALSLQSDTITEQGTNHKFTQHHAKMMLIYSLPSSPIYQPYAAKTLLNNANFSDDDYSSPSDNSDSLHNLAFMLLLKDQLNAQLKLLTAQAALKTKAKQEYARKDAAIEQLEKQLHQLKKIEENLTKHQ
ncbi:hypothetical protein KO495_07035 [Colwellia sp. D2M02]|uniref:hypothetical protein n=1 Tax=Colwellia sp. D2M02 TaxID=2841562 RepID=UPI001C084BC1|nr:hypothetical protein [Colwellia sp. D2M02]MBU2893080.1 hypothetical protein [Colwellia sp. D2M02]